MYTRHHRLISVLSFLILAMAELAYSQTPLRLEPVSPCRLVDTRTQNGGSGPIQGGTFQNFNLPQLAQLGKFCPAFSLSAAAAYSLNVTLVPVNGGPVAYLTIWPTGEAQPVVSLMNSLDGRIKANAAIVPAGTNGQVSVYVTNTTNVLLDINAYFDSASDGAALAFFPLTPCRVVDTRTGNGGPLQGGVERDFPMQGICNIPTTAKAYSLNLTVVPVNDAPVSYLTTWPFGSGRPVVSTLNDLTGTIVANAAIVPAGTSGEIAAYASTGGSTNLLVDVNGYFAPANSASNPLSLYTLTPCRILDTRKTVGLFNGTLPVGIVGSVCGIPNLAQAFVLNATVVPAGSLGYLTLWPEGENRPVVSTLNALDGAITSNMAIVPAGAGNESINAYADTGTQLILDISSYFAPITTVNVATPAVPDGALSAPYSYTLLAVGGVPPYTWRITSGALPPGMNPLSSGGVISGTPSSTGNYTFTVQATDSNTPPGIATAHLSMTVDSSPGALTITSTSLPGGAVSTPYNAVLTANGGIPPYTWSATPLPAGLVVNTSTGLISGTPAAAGATDISLVVTDSQLNTQVGIVTIEVNTGAANGVLNGSYALTFSGFDNGHAFVAAASLTFDGNGHVTAGEDDINNSSSGAKHGTVTGGTYSIGANGLGQISFTDSAGGNVQLLVTTAAAENMRVIGFNQNGSAGTWGSGVLRQQNPVDFNPGALQGNWAFGFQGSDPLGDPTAGDGAYQEDSSGNLSNGIEDINDFGTHPQTTFTGHSTSSIDSNGRATVQYEIVGIGTTDLAVYVVSGSETLGIGSDTGGSLYVTNGVRQSGAMNNGTLNGASVGRGSRIHNAGQNNAASQALAVLLDADGQGNIGISEYLNTGGNFSAGTENGTYTVTSNSRAVFSFTGGAQIVCYLITSNEGFCINAVAGTNDNVKGAEVIYFEPQPAPPGGSFSNTSFSGEYLGGSLPQYTSSTFNQVDSDFASGAGTFYSTYSQSGPGGTNQNLTLSAAYTVNAAGAIIIYVSGVPAYYGFIVSPTRVALVSATNPLVLIETTSSAPHHP